MRKNQVLIIVMSLTLSGATLLGCNQGNQKVSCDIPQNVSQEKEKGTSETQKQTLTNSESVTKAEENATQNTQKYEDNFAVDSNATKEFANEVQKVTAKKDLEGLAALTSFPVYVGLPGVGVVETKEDFLKLGADTIFTEELLISVANADIDHFEPSRAGFSISNGGKANINFGVRDGVLSINGINY